MKNEQLKYQTKCIICLKHPFDPAVNHEDTKSIYLKLVQEVEDYRISINFCSICSQKLQQFNEFIKLCQDSLKQIQTNLDDSSDTEYNFYLDSDEELDGYKEIPKLFHCNICNKNFDDNLSNHMRQYHLNYSKSGSCVCKICSKSVKADIEKHFQKHLDFKKPKVCEKPDKELENIQECQNQEVTENNKIKTISSDGLFECHFCSKKCRSKQALSKHIGQIHFGASLLNDKDKKPLRQDKKLKAPKKAKLRKFICDFCGEFRKRKLLLKHHIQSKHMADRIACDICNKTLSSIPCKYQHVKEVHGKPAAFCEICGKGFPTQARLNNHKKMNHNAETLDCDVCGKKFSNAVYLGHHKKTHLEVRQFKCPYCESSFKVKATLLKHFHLHAKTKPYNCLKCDQGYYMLVLLKKHYLTVHGINYTAKETAKNCRIEKPKMPEINK